MKATQNQKLDELFDQLDQLKALVATFQQGHYAVYKSISVSLRLLLVGSSGDRPLVEDVLPAIELPKLIVVPPGDMEPDHLCLPAKAIITGAGRLELAAGCKVKSLMVSGGSALSSSEFDTMFEADGTLPFGEWKMQSFLRPSWTLQDFIRTVAHKDGGAHFDPNQDQLRAMQNWGHFHWHLTACLALNVVEPIRSQLILAFPSHTRPIR